MACFSFSAVHLTCFFAIWLCANIEISMTAYFIIEMDTTEQLNWTGHGMDWFQIGKGVWQGCILSPCLFSLYAEYIMRNARLDEAQAGIKIAGRNINNLICRWHHLYGRKWRRTKELLDESERGEWKVGLKLDIHKTKIMTSSPITSWQIGGETMENHCKWWVQPWNSKTPPPWKKSYDQPKQHINKQTHYFANKGLSSQSYGFSAVTYVCESWTIMKAEHWRIDASLNCGVGEHSWQSLGLKGDTTSPS